MALLQLALDLLDMDSALNLVERVGADVDIVEVGTPFVMRYGMEGVRRLRAACSGVSLLCDGKIMDAGREETDMMTAAGADWVTVMACTDEATLCDCVQAAHAHGARVMADLLGAGALCETVRKAGGMRGGLHRRSCRGRSASPRRDAAKSACSIARMRAAVHGCRGGGNRRSVGSAVSGFCTGYFDRGRGHHRRRKTGAGSPADSLQNG